MLFRNQNTVYHIYSTETRKLLEPTFCSEDMSADLPFQPGARDAAGYIAELTADLARLARESGFKELAYLLEIARMEAEMKAGRAVGPRPPEEHR